MKSWRLLIGLVLLLAASRFAWSAPSNRAATGRMRLNFTERAPAATQDSQPADYDIAKESFEVFVPSGYKSDRPHALLVWICADKPLLPDTWAQTFNRARVIWICPSDSGNQRPHDARLALGLDAAHNIRKLYTVDPDRTYVGGFSGGANVASHLILDHPDVFRGAFCLMGGSFYAHRADEEGEHPTVEWPGSKMPFDQARRELRVVLMTSDGDFARRSVKADAEAFRLDAFEHATLLQVPRIGHQLPDGNWMEKGLQALDRGRIAKSAVATSAPATRATTRFTNANSPLPAIDPDAQAQRLLNTARLSAENGYLDRAAPYAQRVINEYPQSPAAQDAKLLLQRIDYIRPLAMPGANLDGDAKAALFSGRVRLNSNMHDLARIYFDRTLTLSPGSGEAKEAKAWLDWMDRNPQAAARKPTDPDWLAAALYHSAVAYSRNDKPHEAQASLARLLREYPRTRVVPHAKKLLEKLK